MTPAFTLPRRICPYKTAGPVLVLKDTLLALYHLVNPANILFHFLYILAPVPAVLRGEYHLGGGSGAAGRYGLHLLHNKDVVDTGFAGQGIPHILKIAGHVLLAVQIIGLHTIWRAQAALSSIISGVF